MPNAEEFWVAIYSSFVLSKLSVVWTTLIRSGPLLTLIATDKTEPLATLAEAGESDSVALAAYTYLETDNRTVGKTTAKAINT